MAVEAATYHKDRLSRHPEDYPPEIRKLIEVGQTSPGPEYKSALELRERVNYELRQRDLPVALAVPATTGPAGGPETTGDPSLNSPWSFLGLPVVSFPIGWTSDGLPLAAQVVGESFSEARILGVAGRCELVVGFVRRSLSLG
jgi:Asp-tRNA(Asn)/Glu-tRNA(Gln) amidotransferase A subunit family amidase